MSDPDKIPPSVLDIAKIGHLARLTLSESETQSLAHDLDQMLSYIQKLQTVDTATVVPTTHAIELETRLRSDEVGSGLPLERSLQNAPERLGDGFGVPKIIE